MSSYLLPFVLCPLLMGLVLFFLPDEKLRWHLALVAALTQLGFSFSLLAQGEQAVSTMPLFLEQGISLETSPFALVYAVIACGVWVLSILASKDYFAQEQRNLKWYYLSLFFAFSGTLGVFFAYDLLTLFIFFELMSFSSTIWVLHGKGEEARKASSLYLSYGTLSGLILLLGIFYLIPVVDSLSISHLGEIFKNQAVEEGAEFACQLMFVGFGAKAGVFLLHEWMPSTYTHAPAPASGILSSVLSKCGLYGIMIVMVKIMSHMKDFNTNVLFFSVMSMVVGGCLAFLSTNIKTILAYSSFAQMGFMLWGLSIYNLLMDHEAYAVYGFVFHSVNHSFIKIILFLLAGVMFTQRGSLELKDLQGYGKGKPWFQALWTVSALSLAAVPLFPVYASKTLLHEAMVELIHYNHHIWIYSVYEWLFLFAGGCTVAYMLKVYRCLFLEGEAKANESQGSPLLLGGLSVLSLLMLACGLMPNTLFGWLGAYTADFFQIHSLDSIHYFTWTNLKGSLISIVIGVVLYFIDRSYALDSDLPLYRTRLRGEYTFLGKIYQPCIQCLSLIFAVFARIFDILLEFSLAIFSRSFLGDEKIPQTFFVGEEAVKVKSHPQLQIKQSLAYSLLMFGLGFIFTIVYLLIVGGTLQLDLILGDFY